MDIHRAFRQGAKKLAESENRYSDLHKSHGIEEHHWQLLTQDEYWTPEQARQIRAILAAVAEVSLTIAGMPAVALPGHYVAALISEVVAPPNRLLACMKAPETFNAVDAAGIEATFEVKPMNYEQLMSLVLLYSGGYGAEPSVHRLPKTIEAQVEKQNLEVKK